MKKCYIITAYIDGVLSEIILSDKCVPEPEKKDLIICADGGYEIATSFGIEVDIVIGDADSGNVSPVLTDSSTVSHTEFIRLQKEKDESDTFLCVNHAVNLGFEEVVIVGGIGGRLDHTISNIQTLAHFSSKLKKISMFDEKNFATVIENSQITLYKKSDFSISLFSLSEKCVGVTATGLYYPLHDAELKNSYPIGLSNEFSDEKATIEVKCGKLLIIMSKR